MKAQILSAMKGDSEILEVPQEISNSETEEILLIYATKNSLLYRIRKDGKYFLLKRSAIRGERGKKILRREYELSIGNDHPNIVDVYEYRRNHDEDEMVMEYVEGRTLNEFLSETTSHKTKKRIFSELIDALTYLHQRRIIHNDLKPENVLVSRNGNHIKLIDLGLSDDDAHYEYKTLGFTSRYAAPELKDERKTDARSDIYSMGLIMQQIFGRRYSTISNKCLRKDPDKRFQNLEELNRKWNRIQKIFIELMIILATVVILAGIATLFLVNMNQKEKMIAIQDKLESNVYELNDQKQQFISLHEAYTSLKDSISREENKTRVHEELKNKILTDYKTKLIRAKNMALDSIINCKKNGDLEKETKIRNNYLNLVKSIYESQPHKIDGEDVKALMFSIYQQSFIDAFEEFKEAKRHP